jgi:hypothetical protein
MTEINWTLINDLRTKPHPLINHDPARFPGHAQCDSIGCGEIVIEARTAQHLLDLAGIPRGHGYDSDADARTYLLAAEAGDLRDRLSRIADWHSRETAVGGMVGDYCNECGNQWPCDTNRMATGTYEDGDT